MKKDENFLKFRQKETIFDTYLTRIINILKIKR